MTKETKQLIEKITQNQLKKIEFSEELEAKIKQAACQSCDTTLDEFESKDRHKEVVFARFIVMWYFHRYQNYTETKAGRIAGKKDHCMTIHACKTMDAIMYDKPERKQWLNNFKMLLNGQSDNCENP